MQIDKRLDASTYMHSHEVMVYGIPYKLQDIKNNFEQKQISKYVQNLYFDYLWTYRNQTDYSVLFPYFSVPSMMDSNMVLAVHTIFESNIL